MSNAAPNGFQPSIIVTGIRDHVDGDHSSGCMGRQYSCECGYDHATDQILRIAADHIEELEAAMREFVAAYKLQDCDNYTEELARAYSIADAALSSGVARAPINTQGNTDES